MKFSHLRLLIINFCVFKMSKTDDNRTKYNKSAPKHIKFNEELEKCHSILESDENIKTHGFFELSEENKEIIIEKEAMSNYLKYSDIQSMSTCENKLSITFDKLCFNEPKFISYSAYNANYIEIKSDLFYFQYDPSSNEDVMDSITKLLYGRRFKILQRDLIIYNENKEIILRSKIINDNSIVATLVLCFPEQFTNSETRVHRDNDAINFVFSETNDAKIKWLCYLNCENGKFFNTGIKSQITITYEIILKEKVDWNLIYKSIKSYIPVYDIISKYVKDLNNYNYEDKCFMGLFLYKDYDNVDFNNTDGELIEKLNGLDLFFFMVLKEYGYHPEVYLLLSKIECNNQNKCKECDNYIKNYPNDIFYHDDLQNKCNSDTNEGEYIRFEKANDFYNYYNLISHFISQEKTTKNLLFLNQEKKQNKKVIQFYCSHNKQTNHVNDSKNFICINKIMIWEKNGKKND